MIAADEQFWTVRLGILVVLLGKYGNKPRNSPIYSVKLMQAFEKELWENHKVGTQNTDIDDIYLVYDIRFVESFASWFGLVEIKKEKDLGLSYFDQLTISKTNLFDKLLELNDN